MAKTPALGRRLDSLLGSVNGISTDIVGSIAEINLSEIEINPNNPRKEFTQEKLDELAASIKAVGIIQPVTVRKIGEKYQLISGERRYRASKQLGLKTIPAYIKIATDIETLVMAVSENLQREDLNPIEVAIQYQALIDSGYTQEKVSDQVGKSRSVVANQMRLLSLPAEIQLALQKNQISVGQAKPLISVDDDQKRHAIFKQIIDKKLTSREVENLVNKDKPLPKKSNKSTSGTIVENEQLTEFFEAKVYVNTDNKGKGKISISFFSEEEYNNILKKILS